VNKRANEVVNFGTDRSKRRPGALRHGVWSNTAVLPGEDPRQFERLYRGLVQEWFPSGPAEEDAVFTLAKCMWRKHRIRDLRDNESKTPVLWWLPGELALEERLDQLIDRALRRLAQMKAMKELLAAQRHAPKALPHARAEGDIEAPSIEAD
jgi:hypothetical protein